VKITTNSHENILVVALQGNILGEPEGTELRKLIKDNAERGSKKIVLDCKELHVVNSSGLGLIIAFVISVRNLGGEMCLANMNSKVEALMVLTRLTHAIKTFDTLGRAIDGLR